MTVAPADIRSEFTRLFDVYWAIGVGVWLVIFLLVVVFVVRFRARGAEADEFPGGTDSRTPVELAYATAIACVVAFLVYLTYSTMDAPAYRATAQGNMPGRVPAGAEVVDVTGAQWHWRFDYPRYGISDVGTDAREATLTVPANAPVELRMRSLDVIHSVWIPSLRFKDDVFPGRTTFMTISFRRPGFQRSGGECNQFCGLRHALMQFNIRVLTRAAYRRWALSGGRA